MMTPSANPLTFVAMQTYSPKSSGRTIGIMRTPFCVSWFLKTDKHIVICTGFLLVLALNTWSSPLSLGQQEIAPMYFCDLMHKPFSALPSCPFWSVDQLALLIPKARTTTAKHRAFAILSLLYGMTFPSIHNKISVKNSPSSLRCPKTFLFRRGC